MADIEIKVRDTSKTKVKTLEQAGIVTQKAKEVAVRTKDNAGKAVNAQGDSPTDYAANSIEDKTHAIADDAAYYFNKQDKKDFVKAKKNVEEIKFALQEVKTKRAMRAAEKEVEAKTADSVIVKTAKSKAAELTKNLPKTGNAAIKQNTVKPVNAASKSIVKKQQTAKIFNKTVQQSAEGVKRSKNIVNATKKFFAMLFKVLKAAINGLKSLISAIVAGGWVAVIVIIIISLIAALACSTHGIFFSSEDSGTGITMSSVVQELNIELLDTIDKEKNKGTYDEVNITGYQADWKDIIAIYTIKTNTDSANPQEVATIDDAKKQLIADVFWDMNTITSTTETVTEEKVEETTDEEGNKVETVTQVTKTILTITITPKSAEDMLKEYGFTDEQKKYYYDLTNSKNDKLWNALIFGMQSVQTIDISNLTFTNESADELQKKIVTVAINSARYGVPANKGYCQAWVADVYQIVVGTRGHAASAVDAGRKWSVSKDWSQIQVGATVYGYSSSQWGHVGIYIGNGMVAHNIGGVKVESLSSWVKNYKGVCWGWEQGINISSNPKYNSVGGLI